MRIASLLVLLPSLALGQDLWQGKVTDVANGAPIAYCSVVFKSSGKGTLTNEDGVFALPAASPMDSIVFSMVGYARRTVASTSLLQQSEVRLTSITTDLRAVEVRPEQEQLFQLVAQCAKRLRDLSSFTSKLYFEMETHMDEQPVEVVECFYNSRVEGPHITTLALKHGRIGIAPLGDRFFVSLNVTKAMSLLDVREQDDQFPANPFNWTRAGAIQKRYRVEERARASDGSNLVNLLLTPRDTSGSYFTVDLWLEASTGTPRSITLTCRHCVRHPFQPFKPMDRILSMDMNVAITFDERAQAELRNVVLNYALDYADTVASHAIRTKAVMHAFEHRSRFLLPLFNYAEGHYDYQLITFQPYDSAFWETAPHLVRTEQQERDRRFFAEHGFLTGSTRMPQLEGRTFFESNYVYWSANKRIVLNTVIPHGLGRIRPYTAPPPGTDRLRQMQLKAQFYMDVDTAGATPRITTATVLDVFHTWYRLPEERNTTVFLNLWFDLCEIERGKLDTALRRPGLSYQAMRALHKAATSAMEERTLVYLQDTNGGANGPALMKWNTVVKEALGIDNFKLDGLQWDVKQQ